jgi:alpha-beta hydrolase superfamily lysophospholipase
MTDSYITTLDGLTLGARSWSVPDPRAVIVLVHGFAASTSDVAVVRQAGAFQAAGLAVISYDGRGHGRSDGRCTLGDLECNDVAAAVAAVSDQPRPIVVVGASMGAIAALRYAARCDDQPIAGVVAISSPAAWRLPRTPAGVLSACMTRTSIGRALTARKMNVRVARHWTNPEPPKALVGRIRVPVAVVHGQADEFIPVADALELHGECREPRRLALVPGMGHAFDAAGIPAIQDAVDWVLDRETTSRSSGPSEQTAAT